MSGNRRPGMLVEASGDIVAKVGDTFVVHMDRAAVTMISCLP